MSKWFFPAAGIFLLIASPCPIQKPSRLHSQGFKNHLARAEKSFV
jgi:hypothetical protein